jgi:hypothetical protein
MSRANSLIESVMYQLKKDNAQCVDLYLRGAVSTDVQTGKITYPETRVRIKKAIVLPIDTMRNLAQSPPFATAGRQFEYGGLYSTGASVIIVERKDLPKMYVYNLDDAFIIKHQRFEIKKSSDFQDGQSAVFIVERLVGKRTDEAFEIRQTMTFTSGVTLG